MQANKNNQFTMSTGFIDIPANSATKAVTLPPAIHPVNKPVVVIPTIQGAGANVNVYVKSQSNSSGSWVITFELSSEVGSFRVAYVAYSSTV